MPLVLPLSAVRVTDLPLVGGKGANLGEMAAAGFPIPDGFCVTTDAFAAFVAANRLDAVIARELARVLPDDAPSARSAGDAIRAAFTGGDLPDELRREILSAWEACGRDGAYAVRSSATAEDLPDASFAGQQDTYLNVRGEAALLERTVACFASLFTERAILYRVKNRIGADVRLCVVVQRMVRADRAGILFTADPVSQRRGTTSIDAGYGLGEALVSGLITPDVYRVDATTMTILERRIGTKAMAIRALPDGGTAQEPTTKVERAAQVLSDAEILTLAALGARVERHYGRPQDIEWAIEDGVLMLTQARAITTLLPIPQSLLASEHLRLLLNFNYLQVMTDPISPLGTSVLRHVAGGLLGSRGDCDALPASYSIGHRLYFDISDGFAFEFVRRRGGALIAAMLDPSISARIADVTARASFVRTPSRAAKRIARGLVLRVMLPTALRVLWRLAFRDPGRFLADAELAQQRVIGGAHRLLRSGQEPLELLASVRRALNGGMRIPVASIGPLIAVSKLAQTQLERIAREAGAERDVAALGRGLIGNVTTSMDLAVGDLCDVALAHPAVRAHVVAGGALSPDALRDTEGGEAFLRARQTFLEAYGVRGTGEIDLARPRLWEDDGMLAAIVRGSVAHKQPGDHRARHAALAVEAEAAGDRLVAAARHGVFGPLRARWVRRLARLFRAGAAIREHPKEALVTTLWLVKERLFALAETLAERSAISRSDDVTMLSLRELEQVVRGTLARADVDALVAARTRSMQHARALPCPPILTSEGEIVQAARDVSTFPVGALVGMAVSGGVLEGIARVIRDPSSEVLLRGEVLVAPATDPGWTPLFLNAAALVMEVGGLMTHGSVIAREYGLPAVAGVEGATTRIRTGQRVRVDGDRGVVELLDDPR